MWTETQSVSAFELAFYSIALIIILILLIRHGRDGILGWLMLFSFSSLRLVSAGLKVGNSTGAAAIIIGSVGLSPLLLSVAGITHEAVVMTTNDPEQRKRQWIVSLLIHMMVGAGVGLAATGASNVASPKDKTSLQNGIKYLKTGNIILFVTCIVILGYAVFSFLTVKGSRLARQSARTLLLFVFAAYPFLLVRAAYSIRLAFHTADLFGGNFGALVGCEVVMQVIVTGCLLAGGLKTMSWMRDPRRTAPQGPEENAMGYSKASSDPPFEEEPYRG